MTLRTMMQNAAARRRAVKPIEKAADYAALATLMMSSNYIGWTWVAYAGAALGGCSLVAMIYFYFRDRRAVSR